MGGDVCALPTRDVRDLALAVIEGAVAAEALARELRKAPDRSRHFQEIAARLRSVVGRPSVRSALTDEAAQTGAPPTRATPLPEPRQASTSEPSAQAPATEHLDGRLARIEATLARLDEGLDRALARAEQPRGERYAVRNAEEAIALAAKLTERLRTDGSIVINIEP